MKTKQLKLLSLLLCFAWLFAFTANAKAEQVSDIVLSLIESQKREIDTIKDEYKALQKNLNNNLLDLTNKTNEISLNFHSLSSIFENGSLSPNARSILTKQINELHAELKAHYTPLEEAQKTIDLRAPSLRPAAPSASSALSARPAVSAAAGPAASDTAAAPGWT